MNEVDRPFWNALHSPLLSVECKNWSGRVGAREIRDCEGKIRNHAALVQVGFFVAVNGYTNEAHSELKRTEREGPHIVLLTGADIDEYVASGLTVIGWLEMKMSLLP